MNISDSLPHFAFGAAALDAALGAGLPVAALHEVHARGQEDFGCASAFTLLLAQRAIHESKPLLWVDENRHSYRLGHLYPPGLMELGVDPDAIIHATAPDPVAALRVAADASRSAAMGAVLLTLSGKNPRGLDMTATRRLSLFARESKLPVFLLREDAAPRPSAPYMPSAAYSRWQVAAAPSRPLAANAPGHPVFDVTLLRHRGGIDGLSARLEWDRENRKFSGHIGSVPALPASREALARMDGEQARKRA